MSTQQERIVRIENSKTGQRYAVSEYTFKHTKMSGLGTEPVTYQDAGFEIVSYEDGTAYEDGAEPTKYAIDATARMPEIGASEPDEPATTTTRTRTRDVAPAPALTTADTDTANQGKNE